MDALDYKVDLDVLDGGNVQLYQSVYSRGEGDDFLTVAEDDHKQYLVVRGKMALIMNKPVMFFEADILSTEFIKHMAKHTDVTQTDSDVTLARKLPFKLGTVSITGTWEHSTNKIVDWLQSELDLNVDRCYTLFSAGHTNLTANDGAFCVRAASTNYQLEDGKTLIVTEFIAARKPRLLKYPSLINVVSKWAINHYLPKIVRRARNFDVGSENEQVKDINNGTSSCMEST